MKLMRWQLIRLAGLALVVAAIHPQAAAQVIFADNFDDNTNTGWTYLVRQGAEEVADAAWVETGGRLEQPVANYDFPRDAENDPFLGTIALAPVEVGGHYSITVTLISLEPGNGFQDEDIVFGYVDENNFFYVETIPNGANLFRVVDANRMLVQGQANPFSHDPTVVTLEHNAETGDVVVTYGGNAPLFYSDAAFIIDGQFPVGVGSNNDAFAIDDFSVTNLGEPDAPFLITEIVRDSETGNVSLTWNSLLGEQYFLDRSTDLRDWEEIEDFTGEAGTTSHEDANVPEGGRVYYRVRGPG